MTDAERNTDLENIATRLAEMANAAEAIFENAERLYFEAALLCAAGAFERGLFLHQISLEECAKIEMLGAWETSALMNLPVDETKVKRAFCDHGAKNRINVYMQEVREEEAAANEQRDWTTARDAFKRQQREFHQTSNAAKNAALYVDYRDGKAIAPRDQIIMDMAAETAARNRTYLGLMQPKTKLLRKWADDPASAQAETDKFSEVMHRMMKEHPNRLDQAMNSTLAEMLAWKKKEPSSTTEADKPNS